MIRQAQDAKFGDYQANCAMPLGKKMGQAPRDIAAQLVEHVNLTGMFKTPEVAGPGFINLTIDDAWLESSINKLVNDDRLGVVKVESPEQFVIDFSSPNVAKPMHVGHLRSTVLGDALCRILRFLGHDVISDNHIGDWGTQFGMIIYGYKNFLDKDAFQADSVAEFSPDLKTQADAHPNIAVDARAETAKLHAGDPENKALWDQFLPLCLAAIQGMYDSLDIKFDKVLGESYYNPMLPDVITGLKESGLASDSEGAVCVFTDGNDAPFIVQKTDGAYTYATTDLATIQYRIKEFGAQHMLYVVDARQGEHFGLLFDTAKRWGYDSVEYKHVSFGTILGPDKKPYKTRSGVTVGLEGLLQDAIAKARVTVGIGGIKYADLHHNRDSDYEFSFDKMLATTGDTATYMQYAHARICGIFRKGEVDRSVLRSSDAKIAPTHPLERALALQLLRFSEAISEVVVDYRPNQLTNYLFETANRFSTFYDACVVLKEADASIRSSRLLLCDLTARTISHGLSLLGIDSPEMM
ncbi:UNVERIFIED_CONTAM: hypothetical protein GTU68_057380 [Idotea baltica]|nr:hypothetical protein [Idotea baltica]